MKFVKFGAFLALGLLLIAVFTVPISAGSSGGNSGSDHCQKKVPKYEFSKDIDYSNTTSLIEMAETGMVDEKYYPLILAQLPAGVDESTEFTIHIYGVLSGCGTAKDVCHGYHYDLRVTFDGSIDLVVYDTVIVSLDFKVANFQVKACVADDLSSFVIRSSGYVNADVIVMAETVGYVKSCVSIYADEGKMRICASTHSKIVMNDQTVDVCMKSHLHLTMAEDAISMFSCISGTMHSGDVSKDLSFKSEVSVAISEEGLASMRGAFLGMVGA